MTEVIEKAGTDVLRNRHEGRYNKKFNIWNDKKVKKKVKLSLYQAVEAHRIVRRRDSHNF
jgi:hypothetical protein